MAAVWATRRRGSQTLPDEEPGYRGDHGGDSFGGDVADMGVLSDERFRPRAALHGHARGEEDRVDPRRPDTSMRPVDHQHPVLGRQQQVVRPQVKMEKGAPCR